MNAESEKCKPPKPPKPPKPKQVFVMVYVRISREPITEKPNTMPVTLEKIPFGYQDTYKGVADEDFENPVIIAGSGSGEQRVEKTGPKTLQLIVLGNGAAGTDASPAHNTFSVKIDGHVGEGEVDIITDFEYDVVSADATEISFSKVSRDKIPV